MLEFVKKSLDNKNLGSSQIGEVINISNATHIAVHVIWSGGTGTQGTIYVEGSIDGNDFQPVDFNNIESVSGGYLSDIDQVGYIYLRIRWNCIAGSGGTITAHVAGKQ